MTLPAAGPGRIFRERSNQRPGLRFSLPASDDAGIFLLAAFTAPRHFYGGFCRPAFWRRFPSPGAFATLSAPRHFRRLLPFPQTLRALFCRPATFVLRDCRAPLGAVLSVSVDRHLRRPSSGVYAGRTGRPRKKRRGRFSHLDLFRRICYNQTQQEPLCRHRPARHCQIERRCPPKSGGAPCDTAFPISR